MQLRNTDCREPKTTSSSLLDQVAQVKRFYERFTCDPKFRLKLAEGRHAGDATTLSSIARDYGLEIDPAELAPLWCDGLTKVFEASQLADFPLLRAWSDFCQAHRDDMRSRRNFDQSGWACAFFEQWRQRQINRIECELGKVGGIPHRVPVVAFELSDGCSVGCWFCGVSASKYAGSFLYTQHNASLWREILTVLKRQIGDPVREGFCYWASDPLDNPDYEKFISDYEQITGSLPSMTTAIPVRDVSRTRSLLAMRKKSDTGHDRFSILTVKILDRLHQEFSAKELLNVECIPQNKDSLVAKTQAGKLYGRGEAETATTGSHAGVTPRTIACVAGFLVNMVKKEIRLISPCSATDKWPDGYIVHRQGHFETAEDFGQVIQSMIDDVMDVSLNARSIIRLRADLDLEVLPDGPHLQSPGTRHTLGGSVSSKLVAKILSEGPRCHGDIMLAVMQAGGNCLAASKMIQELFDDGLISDDPDDINGVGNVG